MAWKRLINLRGPRGLEGPRGFNGYDSKPFPSGGNIDSYRTLAHEGYWTVDNNTIYDSILGTKPPVQSPGVFQIRVQGTAAFQSFEFWLGNLKAIIRRTYSPLSPGLGWSPWKYVMEWDPVNIPRLLPSQNLDTMRSRQWDGDWMVPDLTAFDTLLGDKPPVRSPGFFSVKAMSANDGGAAFMEFRFWFGAQKGIARRTYSPLSPGLGWSAWTIDGAGGSSGTSDASQSIGHQIKKEQLAKAKGGRIGTNNKAAVGVRIDHGFNSVQSSIIALARQYNIPLTMAVMADSVGVAGGESSDVTWSTLEEWALGDGHEMANHARSHADAVGTSALTNAIQGNVESMRTNMPRLHVPSFIQPGVDASSTKWGGFDNATKAENYSLYEAGRIILANHAVASGNVPGQVLPLGGTITQGNAPLPLDLTSQVTTAEAAINAAIKSKSGLNVYFHPNLVGTSGYATLARIESFFAFLAGKVAANEVILLSQAGLALADSASNHRFDLAVADGWAKTGNVTSQTVSLTHLSWAAGYVWCVEATVTAGTGQSAIISVTAAGSTLNATRTQVLPDGQSSTVRKYFTLPIGATALTVSIDTPATLSTKAVFPA